MNNQLSVQKCLDYDKKHVYEALVELLQPFGGINAIIKPNARVLIKPNMLSCKSPERAATTHPSVIEELAKLCYEAGAKKVLIGDSPPAIFGKTEDFWKTTGFADAAKNSGAELVSFESSEKIPVEFKTNGQDLVAYVTKELYNADCVINLSKMKTHNLTRITGAVKNNFGFIPGFSKGLWHRTFPRAEQFAEFIVDFARKLPVSFNIMDGITAMDSQGPASGRVVEPHVLLAAFSPVNIDIGFCNIIGLDPLQVPYLKYCKKSGWWPENSDMLKYVGEPFEKVKYKGYIVPPTPPTALIPEFVINIARKLIRSVPHLTGKCIKCGRCAKICPAKAINISDKQAEFDYTKCISCFCCMEVCPAEAIKMKSSPLLDIYMKIRKLK